MNAKPLNFLICAGMDNPFAPHENANNAECAPEMLAEPAGLVLRTG